MKEKHNQNWLSKICYDRANESTPPRKFDESAQLLVQMPVDYPVSETQDEKKETIVQFPFDGQKNLRKSGSETQDEKKETIVQFPFNG